MKYLTAAVLLGLVVGANYLSMGTPAAGDSPSEPKSEAAALKAEAQPSQPPSTASLSVESVEEFEERRAAARVEAIEAMEKFSDVKTLTALGNALTDASREVKDAALAALSERNGATVTEMIRRGLADADPEFRIEVLEALAERGDLESLRRVKSDPNEDVRERAADLLESAGK